MRDREREIVCTKAYVLKGRIYGFWIGANHDSSIWYEALRRSVSERTQSILIGLNSHSINSQCLFISNTIPINSYWIYIINVESVLRNGRSESIAHSKWFECVLGEWEWVCAAPHWVNNCIQSKFNLIVPSMSVFSLDVCFLSLSMLQFIVNQSLYSSLN